MDDQHDEPANGINGSRRADAHEADLVDATVFGRTIGGSPAMQRLFALCRRLAFTDVSILIEGETGTGKEALAESLHACSARADAPFVVFDCTAVASNLIEDALFGHERGAFTGAASEQRGIFELANGGTLFIDEIGDLESALQPKLLRAIDRSEVRRIGGSKWLKVDVRLITATRRDLKAEVRAGRFRDDLYYRLAAARVELPPLREREGDIALLAESFWRSFHPNAGAIPPEFLLSCEKHNWPGNVRELRTYVATRVALGDLNEDLLPPLDRVVDAATGDLRSPDDVIARILDLNLPLTQARAEVVAEFERQYLKKVLAEHNGDATQAAVTAGVVRRYFQLLRSRRGV